MRKSHALLLAPGLASLAIWAGMTGVQAQDQKPATDEPALKAVVDAFTKAFNAGDARGLAALFSEDAELVTMAGQRVHGREAIEKQFSQAFSDNPGQSIEIKTESVRFLSPESAIEDGTAIIVSPGNEEEPQSDAETTRYVTAYVKRGGKWLHDSIRDYPAPSEPETADASYDHLKVLEGLIGEWIDENDEAEVHTTCQWSENRSFLLRNFRVKVRGQDSMTGVQRVGWDPNLKQIHSWTFDSDGGSSEALWSQDGNRWVIKTTGSLKDGRAASATNILTFVNRDTIKWASVDRTAGAEALPDMEEITLVRKPPAPRASSTSPKATEPARTTP